MSDMYLVVGVKDTYAYATKYNPPKEQMKSILEDIRFAVGSNFKLLYDGPERDEVKKAIVRVSAIERTIEIHGRDLFESKLQDLMNELESVPSRIILIESNLN